MDAVQLELTDGTMSNMYRGGKFYEKTKTFTAKISSYMHHVWTMSPINDHAIPSGVNFHCNNRKYNKDSTQHDTGYDTIINEWTEADEDVRITHLDSEQYSNVVDIRKEHDELMNHFNKVTLNETD